MAQDPRGKEIGRGQRQAAEPRVRAASLRSPLNAISFGDDWRILGRETIGDGCGMALPMLYWMLECTACATRFVVRDSYWKFVGTSDPDPDPDAGYDYGGSPLPGRYTCIKGCSHPLKAIGAVWSPDDRTMWLHEPHVQVTLTRAQSDEWRRLIEANRLACPENESLEFDSMLSDAIRRAREGYRLAGRGCVVARIATESHYVTVTQLRSRLDPYPETRLAAISEAVEKYDPETEAVFVLEGKQRINVMVLGRAGLMELDGVKFLDRRDPARR